MRWNRSSVLQSSYSRRNSSGWTEYAPGALAVIRLVALSREVVLIAAVEADELVDCGIPVGNGFRFNRLEQPATDDLKPFIPSGRTPWLADPLEDVLQHLERPFAVRPADLDIRRGDGANDQGGSAPA